MAPPPRRLRKLGKVRTFPPGARPVWRGNADAAAVPACPPRHCLWCRLFNTAGVVQELLLEVGDVVQRRLGVLLACDGLGVLLLLLGQELEELGHMPEVLLPVEASSPSAVPRPESHIGRIGVD